MSCPGTPAAPSPNPSSTAARRGLFHLDTIADLEALQHMADEAVVLVLGYYAAGDGGGGTFERDADSTATASNGTYHASADGGMWARLFDSGSINVRMFGAKGDGTTNDYAAFSAAHAFAMSAAGSVFIPNGTYKILVSGAAGFNFTAAVKWQGESAGGTVLRLYSAGQYVAFFSIRADDCTFDSFSVVNFATRAGLNGMFSLVTGDRTQWTNLHVDGRGNATDSRIDFIGLANKVAADDCVVSHCSVRDCNIGVWTGDSLSTMISRWRFIANFFTGGYGSALELNDATENDGQGWRDVTISGNIFGPPKDSAVVYSLGSIACSNARNIAITGNLFLDHDTALDKYGVQAIHLERYSRHVTISGNTFKGCKNPIVGSTGLQTVISANVFEYKTTPYTAPTALSYKSKAVEFWETVSATDQVVVSGNTFLNYERCVDIVGLADGCIVKDNLIKGCYIALRGAGGYGWAGNEIRSCSVAFVASPSVAANVKRVVFGRNTVIDVPYNTMLSASGIMVLFKDGLEIKTTSASIAGGSGLGQFIICNVPALLVGSIFVAIDTTDGTFHTFNTATFASHTGTTLTLSGTVSRSVGNITSTGLAVGGGVLRHAITNTAAGAKTFLCHCSIVGQIEFVP